jgi:hypothetical protein
MVGMLFPFFLVAVLVGYVLGLKPIKSTQSKGEKGSIVRALYGLSPILLVIVLNIVFHIGFAIGLCLGIGLLFVENKVPFKKAGTMIKEGFSVHMGVAMVGIMFFRQVVNSSGIVTGLMELLEGSPVIVLMVGLPMVVGLFMGLALLSIGVCFPLLLPLSPVPTPVFAAVVYMSAFTGYFASPLHLCLILTKEYFNSSLLGVYRRFLPSVAVLVLYIICFALFFLWV